MTKGVANLPHCGPKAPPRWRNEIDARDIRILEMAAQGNQTNAMAKELGFSRDYVKLLRYRLCSKLGADNMVQAVAMGLRRGLLK